MSSKNPNCISIAPGALKLKELKLVKNMGGQSLKKFAFRCFGNPNEIGKFIKFIIDNIKYFNGSHINLMVANQIFYFTIAIIAAREVEVEVWRIKIS